MVDPQTVDVAISEQRQHQRVDMLENMRQLDPQTKEASYERGGYMVTLARQPDGGFQIVKDSSWTDAAPAR